MSLPTIEEAHSASDAEPSTDRSTPSNSAAIEPSSIRSSSSPTSLPVAAPHSTQVVIEPTSSRLGLDWAELWRYRELLGFLTWRDIKVRYKQTVLGALWAIIQPLFTMLIFSVLVGRVAGFDQKTGGLPYTLGTYVGLVPWTFFASAVTNSGNSLVGSAHLISKVYFPRMIVPAASVAAALVDFAIAFAFVLPLSLFYSRGLVLSANLLMLPLLVVLLATLALGVGMWMSALNVKFRDIRYVLPFLIQVGLYASPVLIWLRMVDPKYHPWLLLNPMTGVIEGFRSALFGLPFHWAALASSFAIAVGLLLYAMLSFRRMERSFADII
jgi:lipopolysaccharide transport system permease protein